MATVSQHQFIHLIQSFHFMFFFFAFLLKRKKEKRKKKKITSTWSLSFSFILSPNCLNVKLGENEERECKRELLYYVPEGLFCIENGFVCCDFDLFAFCVWCWWTTLFDCLALFAQFHISKMVAIFLLHVFIKSSGRFH